MLNWEGSVQERFFSITTSDGTKHRFKLKQVPAAAADDIFWVTQFDESQDLFFSLNESQDLFLDDVNIELIELSIITEAPKKMPMAKYNSYEKTLTYSKDKLGSGDKIFLDKIVGRTIGLSFNKDPIDSLFDRGVFVELYARMAGFSVEGDDVIVRLTTDGVKTKGKYASEKVEALNKVNSGEYYVEIVEALSAIGIDAILVDIGHVMVLANDRSRLEFKAIEARRLSFDAATETISSVLSNKYLEGIIKTGENNPQLGIKLRVKTKSGGWVVAMDNLERDGLVWKGDAWRWATFSYDDIVYAWLSLGPY